jgi:hypothetical protein
MPEPAVDIELHPSLWEDDMADTVVWRLEAASYEIGDMGIYSIDEPMPDLSGLWDPSPAKLTIVDWHLDVGQVLDRVENRPVLVLGKDRRSVTYWVSGQPSTLFLSEPGKRVSRDLLTDGLFELICLILRPNKILLPEPKRVILVDSFAYFEELLKRIAVDMKSLHSLKPRQFEQFVGFDVTLTKQTRDGGIDIFATDRKRFGEVVYGIECKKYHPDRPIRIGIVREFATAKRHSNVAIGVLCTTSTFTKDALEAARKEFIFPQDQRDLQTWATALISGSGAS